MTQTQVSIDEESLTLLDSTAAASTFSREEALKEAIANYAEYDRWFRAKVESGLQAIKEGRVLSSGEIERRARLRCERLLQLKTNDL